jgi:hypothetical protein
MRERFAYSTLSAVIHSDGVFIRSRPIAWGASVAAFIAAAALQIAIFGVVSNAALPKLAAPMGFVLAAAWLVLPAAIATYLAVRFFRLIGPDPGQRSTQALLALLLLPIISVYLGVVISFDTWGGK